MKNEILNIVNKYSKYDIGIFITDNNYTFKYNEDKLFEAASCAKVFILIECVNQIHKQIISWDDKIIYSEEMNLPGLNSGIISCFDYGVSLTIRDYVKAMIIYSDNIATNTLINLLGLDRINATIADIGLKKTKIFSELNLLKYYKFACTTPFEYAHIFQNLLLGELISKEVCDDVLNILKRQKNSDMLYKGLPPMDMLFKGTEKSDIKYIASKSGSIVSIMDEMKNLRNDGGIVCTKYGSYIISIFISNIDDIQFNYDNIGIEIGGKINNVVYKYFKENEGKIDD